MPRPQSSATDSAELLSAPEAAALLGIGRRLLWTLSATGTLPSVRLGRRRLYPRRALLEWIDAEVIAGVARGEQSMRPRSKR